MPASGGRLLWVFRRWLELEQAAQLPPGKVRDYLLENINRQWYARDPEAAAAFAESHGLSKLPDRFTTDPRPIDSRAALAWLSTRRPAGGSSWAKDFENGFKAAAEADPQAALATATELLAKSPVNDRTLDATRTVAQTWGQRDWQVGWDWAAALPDPAMRRRALAALVGSDKAPWENLAAMVAALPPLALSNELFSAAINHRTRDQWEAWVASLPPHLAARARAENR